MQQPCARCRVRDQSPARHTRGALRIHVKGGAAHTRWAVLSCQQHTWLLCPPSWPTPFSSQPPSPTLLLLFLIIRVALPHPRVHHVAGAVLPQALKVAPALGVQLKPCRGCHSACFACRCLWWAARWERCVCRGGGARGGSGGCGNCRRTQTLEGKGGVRACIAVHVLLHLAAVQTKNKRRHVM